MSISIDRKLRIWRYLDMNNAANVAKKLGTLTIQHIRRTCEAEAIARAYAGESSTAILGLIELATACGNELDDRGHLLAQPAYFDTCIEDGIRYPMQVRVW